MSAWTVTFEIGKGPGPAFLEIARAVAEDIRRGRLRAGDELPGSRTLATQIGVHRNTVLAAYRELHAEGWIASEEARGTFVAHEMPDVAPKRFTPEVAREIAARPGFEISRAPKRVHPDPLDDLLARTRNQPPPGMRGRMSLGGGIPDVRLAPGIALARAMRSVLRRRAVEVLSYGDPEGPIRLRTALAEMVSATRGVAARAENVLVTRGSQMAIDLVARTLVAPGDVIAVEALGYRPAWEALRAAGARLVSVPIDAHGIDLDALEKLCDEEDVRGIYVCPHHQFPTTVTLAPARRLRLLELARKKRLFVLEDDYDHEFHYEGRPVLPIASADRHGNVVYVGTLSKVLAPGVRIGFLVAPASLVERLTAVRRIVDRQGDHLLEHAVAELLEEGEIQRHIRRARRIYAARRQHLADLLTRELGDELTFALPSGGTAIWARAADAISPDAWAERADAIGLVLQPARLFAFDGKARPYLRIGFAQHDEREAKEAVRRMKSALASRALSASEKSKAGGTRATRSPRSSP